MHNHCAGLRERPWNGNTGQNQVSMGVCEQDPQGKQPSDAVAVTKVYVELDKHCLNGVRDFYTKTVGTIDKYEIMKTDHKLCRLNPT